MNKDFKYNFLNYSVYEYLGFIIVAIVALMIIYFIWKVLVISLECFVDSRLVELNKQKDRLWLAAEDLYDATDELKERTWDYDAIRKELRKLSEYVSDLEDYVLNQNYEGK